MLGKIYATDYVEVDLPLSLSRYELLDLPETFQNKSVDKNAFPEVLFNTPNNQKKSQWKGRVVRSGAALDENSRQIKVIARIDNPFMETKEITLPLKIGQYIEAHIKGKTFKNVYVLPSVAVRQNKEILLLKEGKVHIVPVEVLWNSQNETVVRVKQDIRNQQLVTTSLNQATQGMKILTVNEKKQQDEKNSRKNKQEKKAL